MGYRIILTESHIKSLQWAADRGYFPQEFLDGIDNNARKKDSYEVPEHVAWKLSMFEGEDPHSFLACMPDDVVRVIRDFMEEIV